jgi:hypothetical protein
VVRSTWDKVIVDRQGDLSEWVSLLKKVQEQRVMILAFSNNHYAGHGPSTVEMKVGSKAGMWARLAAERENRGENFDER